MREIAISQGFTVTVDDCDADLADLRWFANLRNGHKRYARRTYKVEGCKHSVYMHRIILERILNRELESGEQCDHIDGNSLNNRRENLRLSNQSQNLMNAEGRPNTSSGIKGVSWDNRDRRWCAYINVSKKRHHLGSFVNLIDAVKARRQAEASLHGAYAKR